MRWRLDYSFLCCSLGLVWSVTIRHSRIVSKRLAVVVAIVAILPEPNEIPDCPGAVAGLRSWSIEKIPAMVKRNFGPNNGDTIIGSSRIV